MEALRMSLIGSSRSVSVILLKRFGIGPFRTILTPSDFASVARQSGCAPKRERPLIPEVVCWLMMYVALQTTSMTQGLALAWGVIASFFPALPPNGVTEEAFSQARKALTLRFWQSLWDRLSDRYQARFAPAMLWKGFLRVIAVDGSDVILPKCPALLRWFGSPKNGRGASKVPQGRLVAVCSVFTGFCLHFKFVPLRFSEHVVLQHLIRRFRVNDLALMDRGFFSYAAIWQIVRRRAHYLMRLSNQAAGFAERIRPLGENEWLVCFRPTKAVLRKCPGLPKELTARLIHYQMPDFNPSWLLTSLMDTNQFARSELVELYHERWGIETIYREWKHGLDIQNLRSQTPRGILKEIHAQLMLSNMVRWVMTEATESRDATPTDLSFITCVTHVKNAMLRLVRAGIGELQGIHATLLDQIRSSKIRQRPGRSYPRPFDERPKNRGNGKQQEPARLQTATASP